MAAGKRTRKDNNRTGKRCISLILIVFVAVMSVQIVKTYRKNQEYISRQAELELELEAETERAAELKELEAYTQSPEYTEDVAKSKLGLTYDNEIIFKEE